MGYVKSVQRLLYLYFIMVLQKSKSSYVLPFLILIAKFLKCCYSGACSDRFEPGRVTSSLQLEPRLWKRHDQPSHDHVASEEVGYRLVPHTALVETYFQCL